MNKDRRVLIVARDFWPSTNDQTLRLRHWAYQLQDEGWQVHVAMPRWHPSWPQLVVCHGVAVHRLDNPPATRFRSSCYGRNLTEWVGREMSGFGCIYCDAADGDAHTLLAQLRNPKPPILVRFDPRELPSGASGFWTPTPRCIDACRRASLLIAPTAGSRRNLLQMGIADASLLRQSDPPGRAIDRTPMARSTARGVIAHINHELIVRAQDRVVLCPGELTREWGVDFLIKALGPLVEERRSLRLWILGDGSQRPRIYDLLQYHGLHRLVSLPGVFTCLEQLLQIADLCVFPAEGRGHSWLLPTCLANGIPVLCADSAEVRDLLSGQTRHLCFPANDEAAFRDQVGQWLHCPRNLEHATAQARGELVKSTAAVHASGILQDALRILRPKHENAG